MAAERHNLTRRALLGAALGASALPGVVAGAPGLLGAGGTRAADRRRPWARALAAFRRAEARLAARRAYELSLPAPMRAYPFSEQLDEVFNDLECARLEALRRLLRVPAPNLRALSLKIDLTVNEEVATLTGAETCLAVLKADARRFAMAVEDMPEVRDWSRAERGKFYRPVKQQLTLRLDADLVDWFRRNPGPERGYQTRINRALREYVEREAGD